MAYLRRRKEARYRFEQGVRARLPADLWEVLKADAEFKCFYCGDVFDELEADHLVPIALGGSSDPWNFVPACKECNRLKGPRGAREFLADPTRFLANPTTAQLARIVDVERRLQRRRIRWLERRRLLRERVQRRSAGVEKAVKTRRARLDAEEAEYHARRGRIRDGKNRYRQSLGLDPLPASPEKEAPSRVGGLPPKPAPRFLNPEGGEALRRRWSRLG